MRGDATTAAHIVEVNKHMVNINMQRRDWPTALANVGKINSALPEDEQKRYQPYVRIVSGVALLQMERYHEAAKCFLDVGDLQIAATHNDIISANDVATYGGLLALASMDRSEIQTSVLENANFRTYLELEPHVRKAVSMFVNGRYSACLAILESYRTDYLLDVNLYRHVKSIYTQIRSKCIVQYFIPFSCVTLDSMSAAFAKPDESLEEELVTMIKSGSLKARINTIDKVCAALHTHRVCQ
jgi:COP9 signalosome complex subunit 1